MAGPPPDDRFTRVEVTSEQDLHDWLLTHHAQDEAVWLVTWTKAVPGEHVPHERVLDQLVAFGWTDGIRRRLDDQRTSQLVSPRRTRAWAKSYRDRAEQLEAEGRMQPAGAASVALARATGGWEATAEVDALVARTAAEARVGLRVRSNGWASSAVRHRPVAAAA